MDLFFSTCLFSLLSMLQGISGTTFTVVNKCDHTVWPGILGNSQLDTTGFEVLTGGSRSIQAPPSWSGRFWGRTGCISDQNTGQLTCQTADCGSTQMECNGKGATPPVTLAEFTIGSGTQDFYDVSLVDGYNLPMLVEPSSGSGTCLSTGCVNDLNRQCPDKLRVQSGQACKSACEAFGKPEYCCSGAYASPDTCKPSFYSEMFKAACPKSYSYAYDDATSTFTCTAADYTITFCPSSTSKKSASNTAPAAAATTGTTSPIYGSITGSGEVPADVNISSWFPYFLTGQSSRTVSSSVSHNTLLASAISFLLRDIRDLDNISFSDWFLSKGGTRMSIQRMWDPVAYALGFIDCDNISARCMLTIFSLFATKTEASLLRMLKGSPNVYLSGPIRNYITERGGRFHLRWGCREILYDKSADGETYVTGLAMSKATNKKLVTADAYVAACDVPGIKRLLPSGWRESEFFNNIYELVGVPVVTVQLRYNGWVTELRDLQRARQLRQAIGLDNLLYTPDADFSCFADLALTSPEDYYIEGQGSLLQCVLTPGDPYMPLPNDEIIKRVSKQVLTLFPSSQGLEVIWSSVVKIGQSLYREGPGKDPFRPDQKTPIKNFFLAGSYTKQDYIDSMEGATLSGRQASAYICDAGEELAALRKKLVMVGSQEQMETSSVTDELSLV